MFKVSEFTDRKMVERQVYCNRTLNMRAIRAIGYDMDYTLIHYRVEEWELRAFEYLKKSFLSQGWPVESLEFNSRTVCRGLIIDTEKGNLLKTNRFGFVKKALHGTKPIPFEEQRKLYSRTIVDLADERWVFLNTLFSLSEGCIYSQLVDLLDERKIPEVLGYVDLYQKVKTVLDAAHMEGRLKAEIIAQPDRYVILDSETPLALLDQHYSGKKLMLITNSEWSYTSAMMSYSFDRFLPHGMKWSDLFDLVIVGARKPQFFTSSQPLFEVVTQEGYLKPHMGKLEKGFTYWGGSATLVEKYLSLSGDEILYVGDHMFGDVHVTKNVLRWRTALIIRELEEEVASLEAFAPFQSSLSQMMKQKEDLESQLCYLRLLQQRKNQHYGPPHIQGSTEKGEGDFEKASVELKQRIDQLDQMAAPYAQKATELSNPTWGLLMRAGNDKSYLAYQLERYADIYTSRVSNFMMTTPYAYLRSARGSLPHDSAE